MAVGPRLGQEGFDAIVARHLVRYPAMELEDVYKLAHQACLGSEHAVSDRARAEQRLQSEVAQLGDGPPEPMLDPISTDGRIVRVHLRPYLAADGDASELLDAFVRTANGFRGSVERLTSCWARVEAMTAEGVVPFTPDDAAALLRRMEAVGFPAVHHSVAYVAVYRPAYRVVARERVLRPPDE